MTRKVDVIIFREGESFLRLPVVCVPVCACVCLCFPACANISLWGEQSHRVAAISRTQCHDLFLSLFCLRNRRESEQQLDDGLMCANIVVERGSDTQEEEHSTSSCQQINWHFHPLSVVSSTLREIFAIWGEVFRGRTKACAGPVLTRNRKAFSEGKVIYGESMGEDAISLELGE